MNDLSIYNTFDCTNLGIGEGKNNTALLVSAMGNVAYSQDSGVQTYIYPAKMCEELDFGGYTDWFLPSYDELQILYEKQAIIGFVDTMPGTAYYWSSSENYLTTSSAYNINFIDGTSTNRA